jgi:ABC-type sugar transport system substrate-binding protein
MKKVLYLVLVLVMATAMLVSCAPPSNPSSAPSASVKVTEQQAPSTAPSSAPSEQPLKKYKIGLSYQGPNNDWAINCKAAMLAALAKHADQVDQAIWKEFGWDEKQELADIEDLQTMGIDMLVICPFTDTGEAASIESVKSAGIPVVVWNTAPGTDKYDALTLSDNVADGSGQAQWLCDRLKGKGNIIIVGGAPGSKYNDDQLKGYNNVISKYPDIKVLGTEYASWTPDTAKKIIESYIAKGDKIDGIITSGLMGLGCLQAFVDAKLPVPPMTSGDGWTGFLRAAKENKYTDFYACPSNNFIYAGGAIDLAFDVLNGKTVQKDTIIPPNPSMTGQEMISKLTDDMPQSYWIGNPVSAADFTKYIK